MQNASLTFFYGFYNLLLLIVIFSAIIFITHPHQLHYERTEARRKLLKDQGQAQAAGDEMKVSDRWKRVLGSALSSVEPKDDSKPQPTSLLSKVIAMSRKSHI